MSDWFNGIRETADRFRMLEESTPEVKSEPVKRRPSYTTPSGAADRTMKARNAQKRIQRKKGQK